MMTVRELMRSLIELNPTAEVTIWDTDCNTTLITHVDTSENTDDPATDHVAILRIDSILT